MSTPKASASQRPARLKARDFAGRSLSLATGPESWDCLSEAESDKLLLLGCGLADFSALPFVQKAVQEGRQIYCLFAPPRLLADLSANLPANLPLENPCAKSLPEPYLALSSSEALALAPLASVYFYRPFLRLAPDFWNPLLGRLSAACLAGREKGKDVIQDRTVWLPGNPARLMHLELRQSLTEAGFARILELEGESNAPSSLNALLRESRPEFLLSVNFRGLGGDGRLFYLLRALDIPVAIWLVDNPWHLLSGQRLPWWRDAQIFVSDPGFIRGLRSQGARHVHFLPLAAAPQMWRPLPDADLFAQRCQNPPLFIGRAVFPGHENYFAGCHLSASLCAEAEKLLEQGGLDRMPDYHWWLAKLCANRASPELWPGNLGRMAGLGAELMGRKLRRAWLGAALESGLELHGDQGWAEILPTAEILPQADYYGSLPELYARASAVLNIPNLLLPSGLNQRHFDVWAAGGILFSAESPGLHLFPRYLRTAVSLGKPDDFQRKLAALRAEPGYFLALAQAWREYLAREHSYARRLAKIFAVCGLCGH